MKKKIKLLNNQNGFTLIELLIVIIIISLLAVISIPNFFGFTDKARKGVIISNMRIIVSEITAYESQNDGFPGYNDPNYNAENFINDYKNDFNGLDKLVDELGNYDSGIYRYESDNDNFIFSVEFDEGNNEFFGISNLNGLKTDLNRHLELDDL